MLRYRIQIPLQFEQRCIVPDMRPLAEKSIFVE